MARKSRLDLDAVRAYIEASEYFTVEDIVRMTGVSRGYAGRMVKKYFAYAIHKFQCLPVPTDAEDLVIEEREITGTAAEWQSRKAGTTER